MHACMCAQQRVAGQQTTEDVVDLARGGGVSEVSRKQSMGGPLLQIPYFRLEETAQLLWALASLDASPARSAIIFDAALDHWPTQLRTAASTAPAAGGSRSRRAAHLPKNVSQLAFAYAKVAREYVPEGSGGGGEPAALAWREALPAVLVLVPRFTPQGLTLVLWTYAKLHAAPRLYARLVWSAYPAICAKLGRFTPQGLVMVAYALALARFRHEPLLDVVTGQCTARMAVFSPRVRPPPPPPPPPSHRHDYAQLCHRTVRARPHPQLFCALCRTVRCWRGALRDWLTATMSSWSRCASATSTPACSARRAWAP